jgi:hypothetical protein
MRQSDYAARIADLLLPLTNETIPRGESDMLVFAQALDEYASKVREVRLDMSVSPKLHCFECKRYWTYPMLVLNARWFTPDSCPECYDASEHAKSHGVTSQIKVFRYLSETDLLTHNEG